MEINATRIAIYSNLIYDYKKLKNFQQSIKFSLKGLEKSPTDDSFYINIFILQLVQNESFNKKIEKKYIELFQNKKEIFVYYEMLKILQDISFNTKVNLEEWKEEYDGVKMDWNFDDILLYEWIDGLENKDIKAREKEALGVFSRYKGRE